MRLNDWETNEHIFPIYVSLCYESNVISELFHYVTNRLSFRRNVSWQHVSTVISGRCFITYCIYCDIRSMYHYVINLLWFSSHVSLRHESTVNSKPRFITSCIYSHFRAIFHDVIYLLLFPSIVSLQSCHDSTVIYEPCFITIWK